MLWQHCLIARSLPAGVGGGEIPNSKHQIPNKDQIRRTEIQNSRDAAVTRFARDCISRVPSVATTATGPFRSFEFDVGVV
jgi:hypothetical protein